MKEKLRKFLENDDVVASYCNYDPDTDTVYAKVYTQDGKYKKLKLKSFSKNEY